MNAVLILAIALGAFAATMTGGVMALKLAGKLPLVVGFSAGAVIGVAFFDLAPEALESGATALLRLRESHARRQLCRFASAAIAPLADPSLRPCPALCPSRR